MRPSLIASFLDKRQPGFMILTVTAACNARCSFCFYGSRVAAPDPSSELSAAEYEKISHRCGAIPYLLISGGEPVLRDDLEEIVGHFVRNARASFVTIPSNGLLPEKSLDLFSRLCRRFPSTHFRAAFSIDLPDARHDEARGAPGCLESLVEAAALVGGLRNRTPNLTMEAISVYAPWNAPDMGALREFVRERMKPDNHEVHILRADWPSLVAPGVDPEAFLRENAEFRRHGRRPESRPLSPFFRALNDTYAASLGRILSGRYAFPCRSGSRLVVIDERGAVRLCELRDEVLGDLRSSGYDLRAILHGPQARAVVSEMNRSKCMCAWECAVSTNIVAWPPLYPSLLARTVAKALPGGKG